MIRKILHSYPLMGGPRRPTQPTWGDPLYVAVRSGVWLYRCRRAEKKLGRLWLDRIASRARGLLRLGAGQDCAVGCRGRVAGQ